MLADRWNTDTEQLRHALLGQPDSLVFNGGIDANVFRRSAVYDKLKFI